MKIEYDFEDINDVIKLDFGLLAYFFCTLNGMFACLHIKCCRFILSNKEYSMCANQARLGRDGLNGLCLTSD